MGHLHTQCQSKSPPVRRACSYSWTALIYQFFPLIWSKYATVPIFSNSSKYPFRNYSFHIRSLNCSTSKNPVKSMKRWLWWPSLTDLHVRARLPGGLGTLVSPSAALDIAVSPARRGQQGNPCSTLPLSKWDKLSSASANLQLQIQAAEPVPLWQADISRNIETFPYLIRRTYTPLHSCHTVPPGLFWYLCISLTLVLPTLPEPCLASQS